MVQAEKFRKAVETLKSNHEAINFCDLMAVASVACDDDAALVIEPTESEQGVIGCWFQDGSFVGVLYELSTKAVVVIARDDMPETLQTGKDLGKKLRSYIADQAVRELAS